jgi:hypothetical protein
MRAIAFIGMPEEDEDRSDYRPVPASDRGNDGYHDRGMLGTYQTNDGEPFAPPADVRFETGYGATMGDLKRGYCDPGIHEDAAYDFEAYQNRATEAVRDTDDYDWSFRNRNRRSGGFLKRPRLPTERG